VVIVREEDDDDVWCGRGRCVVAVVDDRVTGITRKLAECKFDGSRGVCASRAAGESGAGMGDLAVSGTRWDDDAQANTSAVSGARRDADSKETETKLSLMRMGEYIQELDLSPARALPRFHTSTGSVGYQKESQYVGRAGDGEARNLFVAPVAAGGGGGGGWQGCESSVAGGVGGGGGEWSGDEKWDMSGLQFVATGGDDCDPEGEESGCSMGHAGGGHNYYFYAEEASGGRRRVAVEKVSTGRGRFAGLC
jgi:hypothetical protein